MNIFTLLLLLTSYPVVGWLLNQSIGTNETFWTQILRLSRPAFKRPSSNGFILLEQMILLKTNYSLKQNNELTEYKDFHLMVTELFEKMRAIGKIDLETIDYILKVLKEDIRGQRKLEEIERKGYAQFSLIQILTFGFLYYSSRTFEAEISFFSIMIIVLSYVLGVVLFYIISKILIKKSFYRVELLLKTSLSLKSFSRLNLSIKQVTEMANFKILYQIKLASPFEKRIFEWLENSITLWKNHGESIGENLDHIIEQIVAQRELIQEGILVRYAFLMFFISAVFGLLPFFYTIFALIGGQVSL